MGERFLDCRLPEIDRESQWRKAAQNARNGHQREMGAKTPPDRHRLHGGPKLAISAWIID